MLLCTLADMHATDQPQIDYLNEFIPGPRIDVEVEDFVGFVLTPIRGSDEYDSNLQFELTMDTSSLWTLYDILIAKLPSNQRFESRIGGIYMHGPIPQTLSIDGAHNIDMVVDQYEGSVYERRRASYLVKLARVYYPVRRNFRGHVAVSLQVKGLRLDFDEMCPILDWSEMIIEPILRELSHDEISLSDGHRVEKHTGFYEFAR
jgi:hypothetical protein